MTKLQQVLFNFTKTTHSQGELLTDEDQSRGLTYQNYDPSADFWAKVYTDPQIFGSRKLTQFWPHIPSMTQNGSAPPRDFEPSHEVR